MRRVVAAAFLVACGARTNVDVAPAADVVTVEQEDVPPLACATSFARCKERHGKPVVVSAGDESVTEFVGDIAAIDAQRLVVVYKPTGRRDVEIVVVGPDGSVGTRQRVTSTDAKPRVTFHTGFATGVLRTANTTTVLDSEARPGVVSRISTADGGSGTPVVPVSLGYVAWATDSRGGAFFHARASSRGLEWERDGFDPGAVTQLEIARRSEGLPRSFVATDGRSVTVYPVDDDGRVGIGHTNHRTARGFLLGAVETEGRVFALIDPIDIGPISLVDMEDDTSIVAADGATFGDVLSLDDQSIVVASASGGGAITLRSLTSGAAAFGDARQVSGVNKAGMLRMAPTRTGFAMIWMGTSTTSGARASIYYQRWDCCPSN